MQIILCTLLLLFMVNDIECESSEIRPDEFRKAEISCPMRKLRSGGRVFELPCAQFCLLSTSKTSTPRCEGKKCVCDTPSVPSSEPPVTYYYDAKFMMDENKTVAEQNFEEKLLEEFAQRKDIEYQKEGHHSDEDDTPIESEYYDQSSILEPHGFYKK